MKSQLLRGRASLDVITNMVLVVAIITSTGLIVRREMSGAKQASTSLIGTYVKDWRSYLSSSSQIGSQQAPFQFVEFADFECPACRQFHDLLSDARRRHGDSIALNFIHFPLPYHAQALKAATASECVRLQGRFEKMHDVLFSVQDSIARTLYSSLAVLSEVSDSIGFARCMALPATSGRIRLGVTLGNAIEIAATPTILLNGWRLRTPPSNAVALDSLLVRVLRTRVQ